MKRILGIVATYAACVITHITAHAQAPAPVNQAPIILPEYKVTVSKYDIERETWYYAAWDDIEIISSSDFETTTGFLQIMNKSMHAMKATAPGFKPRAMIPFATILHGDGPTRSQLYSNNRKPEPLSRLIVAEQGGRQILCVQGDPEKTKSDNKWGNMVDAKYYGGRCARFYFYNRLDQHYPPIPRWFVVTIQSANRTMSYKDRLNMVADTAILGNFELSSLNWQNTTPADKMLFTHQFRMVGRTIQGPPPPAGSMSIPGLSSFGSANNTELSGFAPELVSQKPLPSKTYRVRPMPMARMFAMGYEESLDTAKYPYGLWELQCLTFWHYCCVRADAGPLKQGYMKLVEKFQEGPITEDVFRECLGMGFADMEKALFQYVGIERAKQGYDTLEIPFTIGPPSGEIPLRKATQAEVARIKGECLAFQGKLGLARRTMLTVYDRNKADPALCAALGVLEYKAGDLEKARPLLTAAVQGKIPNPEVYRTLARIKLDDALGVKKGKKPAHGKRLTPEQAAEIYGLLQSIRQMPPLRAETYALLAEMLSYTDAPPSAEQTAFIEEGKRWFPDGKNPAPYPWDYTTHRQKIIRANSYR